MLMTAAERERVLFFESLRQQRDSSLFLKLPTAEGRESSLFLKFTTADRQLTVSKAYDGTLFLKLTTAERQFTVSKAYDSRVKAHCF